MSTLTRRTWHATRGKHLAPSTLAGSGEASAMVWTESEADGSATVAVVLDAHGARFTLRLRLDECDRITAEACRIRAAHPRQGAKLPTTKREG